MTLSSGEQQRVGIARALVAQPTLLIADEPTGNLDPQLSAEIMQLFASLPAQGTAVLVASHDLHLIRRMRKRVLVLDHGRTLERRQQNASQRVAKRQAETTLTRFGAEGRLALDVAAGLAFQVADRKSVAEGKSVSVRVGQGGRRNINKK